MRSRAVRLQVVGERTRLLCSLLGPGPGCCGACSCFCGSCHTLPRRCCRCRRCSLLAPGTRSRKTFIISRGPGREKIEICAGADSVGRPAEFTVSAQAIGWHLRIFGPPGSPPAAPTPVFFFSKVRRPVNQKCVCFVVVQYYAGFRSLAALPSRLCPSLLLPPARSVLQHFLLVLLQGRLRRLLPLLRSSRTRPLKTKKNRIRTINPIAGEVAPKRPRCSVRVLFRFLRSAPWSRLLCFGTAAFCCCSLPCCARWWSSRVTSRTFRGGAPCSSRCSSFCCCCCRRCCCCRFSALEAFPRPTTTEAPLAPPVLPLPLPPHPGAASVSFSRPVLHAGPCPGTSSRGHCRSGCGSAAGCGCRRGTGGHGSRRACCCCCCRCCSCRETNFGHFRRCASRRRCCFCFCRWFCCPWRRRRGECATPRGRGMGEQNKGIKINTAAKRKKKRRKVATGWPPGNCAAPRVGSPAGQQRGILRCCCRRR